MRSERGFALVVTLIVTALLVALLVEFVREVYVDTSHSHNFVASQQAGILAESGIAGGIKLLQASSLSRQGQNYSSFLESWAKPFTYDKPGVGSVTITIEEESGKFNLNTATTANGTRNTYTEMATRLFKTLQLSTDLAEVLMDWVDENDAPGPGGAETNYYGTLKPPYAAKNARLETVEELALLKGFTPAALTKLRPCVTVYGVGVNDQVTRININTAPKEVIAALDETLREDVVTKILDARKTRPIKGQQELVEIVGSGVLSPSFLSLVTYGGTVYRIRAEGKVRDSVSIAEAVVSNVNTLKPTILYWREY